MPVSADHIATIRAFNRFYTNIIGLLNEGIMSSDFALAEARLIHEIGKHGRTTASALRRGLDMDAGQMSRLVWRLMDKGVIATVPDTSDRRSSNLSLTADGDIACSKLDTMSDAAATGLIEPLGKAERQRLVESMRIIQSVLSGEVKNSSLTLRPHRIGELGWLIHRQAILYNQEYGWNGEFEALIAKIYADFEAAVGHPPKSLWIAEYGGDIAGSVFVMPVEDEESEAGVAQLRMLYVEPFARGNAIGRKLVEEAVIFARNSGYRRMILWTQDCLVAARKTYQGAGFHLVREEKHNSFGRNLNGQYWEIQLARG